MKKVRSLRISQKTESSKIEIDNLGHVPFALVISKISGEFLYANKKGQSIFNSVVWDQVKSEGVNLLPFYGQDLRRVSSDRHPFYTLPGNKVINERSRYLIPQKEGFSEYEIVVSINKQCVYAIFLETAKTISNLSKADDSSSKDSKRSFINDCVFNVEFKSSFNWSDASAQKRKHFIKELFANNRVIFVNSAFKEVFHKEDKSLLGGNFFDSFHFEFQDIEYKWSHLFDCGTVKIEKELIHPIRQVPRFYSTEYSCTYDSQGRITGILGSMREYTPSSSTTLRIKELENDDNTHKSMLEVLLKSIPDLVFYKDIKGKYLGCNDAFIEHLGLSVNEIVGKNDYDLYERKKAIRYNTIDKKVFKTGSKVITEETVSYPDGSKRLFELVKNPVRDSSGMIIGLIGIGREVSEHVRIGNVLKCVSKIQEILISEMNLEKGVERSFRFLIEMFLFDSVYIYRNDNPNENTSFSQLYEFKNTDIALNIENPGMSKIPYKTSGLIRWKETFEQKRVIKGHLSDFPSKEIAFWKKENVQSLMAAPIFIHNQFYGFIGVYTCLIREYDHFDEFLLRSLANTFGNIIERSLSFSVIKQTNEELSKINKELDSFVYSTSHDLRAPIASLLGLVGVMELELFNPQKFKEYLELQKSQIVKLDNFIKEILDYSRNTRIEVKQEVVDISTLIAEAAMSIEHAIENKKVKYTAEHFGEVFFTTDSFRLKVILNNLLSNAFKFSGHRDVPEVRVTSKVDNIGLHIEVSDNGEGIEEQFQNKIYEMFFRASEIHTGSGLGLYIVKETIDRLNGTIHFDSKRNVGTVFQILIPTLK